MCLPQWILKPSVFFRKVFKNYQRIARRPESYAEAVYMKVGVVNFGDRPALLQLPVGSVCHLKSQDSSLHDVFVADKIVAERFPVQ